MRLFTILVDAARYLDNPARLPELRLTRDPALAHTIAARDGVDGVLVAIEIDEFEPEDLLPLTYDIELVLDPSWDTSQSKVEALSAAVDSVDPWATSDGILHVPEHAWWVSLDCVGVCLARGGVENWKLELVPEGDINTDPDSYGP